MQNELETTIPLGAAIRALEQAKGPDEIMSATLRLQSTLEQMGPNPGGTVRALTMAAARAVDAAIALAKIHDAQLAGSHPAASVVAAAYRQNSETRQ